MALASVGFETTIMLKDGRNRRFNKIYKLDSADLTAATSDVAVIVAALAAVTQLKIEGYRISEVFMENAFTLPSYTVNGYDQAAIVGNLEGELETVTFYIPGPTIDIFQSTSGAGANIVDVTHVGLNSYAGIWKTSTGVANISDGEYLDDSQPMRSGQRINRKSTN